MSKISSFTERVFFVVKHIPRGEVLTYKEVAKRAGSLCAYRAVGTILSKNFNPTIPCHRVIKSDGSLGGYNRGIEKKKEMLFQERNSKFQINHKLQYPNKVSFF